MNGVIAPLGIVSHRGFQVVYNRLFKNADLVTEVITKSDLGKNIVSRKGMQFREDQKVSKVARSTLQDYKNSGLTRGHMAPACYSRFSAAKMYDSFYLSNATPQFFEFNNDLWKRIEQFGLMLMKSQDCDLMHILSGPLYLTEGEFFKIQVIGVNHVAVPTHFFKVFVTFKTPSQLKMHCFMTPHSNSKGAPIKKFQCSLRRIEEASGFDFFVNADPFFAPLISKKQEIEPLP